MLSAAASALMMPRRTRSWRRRSRFVAISGTFARTRAETSCWTFVLSFRAVLAAMVPRDIDAKRYLQPAEADRQPGVAPFRRRQDGGDTRDHEAHADQPAHRPAAPSTRPTPRAVEPELRQPRACTV